ncbi:DUF1499 domain-containing protein [Mesorhizobium sp.]|uniref:DUF1499 domain-containing protein n=1 Tax=Mesorhizobium sp. TaxID=1871066 RepID=UPI000FE9D801|nr:DUF1499 domain-containing protein [Mesorhizobium sp.]RWK37359.1 MAG: DUF1499 domain-containing protein [Mesorhizobium sp.]RWK66193.1 MAG: DUF1499 domain-containing protein [Mesorhizobium sp.]RWK73271.1 MAG: DUF1499 domain-containing protein [Mesorhizobium sp.]RWK75981.1 MAG: DUF1499 domain-containing protein [Mesorhizobium sp.]RWL00594.1 MAG: DUF1499 domain-containing protein [Mesorhizobium sp.]
MRETPARRTTRAAGWSRRAGAFSAVLLLTVLVGHRYGLVETPAFLWVLGIVALLAAFALLFAGFAFSRIWNFGDRGGRDLSVGAVLALLVLAPFGIAAYWAATSPPLRDISTDFDDPPVLDTSTRTADMNALSPPTPGERRLQTETYPLVTGRSYNLPFDRVLEAVATVLGRRDWQFAAPFPRAIGQSEVTINALARSFVLSLPADVAIRVTDDGDAVTVDMRSASRYGRYDLGDNAARIVDFLTELDQEVAGQVGTAQAE